MDDTSYDYLAIYLTKVSEKNIETTVLPRKVNNKKAYLNFENFSEANFFKTQIQSRGDPPNLFFLRDFCFPHQMVSAG